MNCILFFQKKILNPTENKNLVNNQVVYFLYKILLNYYLN